MASPRAVGPAGCVNKEMPCPAPKGWVMSTSQSALQEVMQILSMLDIQQAMEGSPSCAQTPNPYQTILQMFIVRLNKACRNLCGVATIPMGKGWYLSPVQADVGGWVSQIVRGVLDQASYLKSAMICGVVLDERNSIVTVYTSDPNIFFLWKFDRELVLFFFYT